MVIKLLGNDFDKKHTCRRKIEVNIADGLMGIWL